jgi:hypothetical protein
MVYEMGGWIKGQAQALSPFSDLFIIGSHLIQGKKNFGRQKGRSQMFDGHGKEAFFPEGVG